MPDKSNTTDRPTRILLAEDSDENALLFEAALLKGRFAVDRARDGAQALGMLEQRPYDLLLTDWMMPMMDGLELVRRVRRSGARLPIVLLSAYRDANIRLQALDAGADEFLAKPCPPSELLDCVRLCLARARQRPTPPPVQPAGPVRRPDRLPAFPAVCVAASTGGPDAMEQVIRTLDLDHAACLAVLHGPAWMLEGYATRLQKVTNHRVHLGATDLPIEPGAVYLAPGGSHMSIASHALTLQLTDSEPENFVRPAADPLFHAAASRFGARCIGVVLTGLGRDGTRGAHAIAAAGGQMFVQDPATCVAPFMPASVIEAGIKCERVELQRMGARVNAALAAPAGTPAG